MVLSSKYNCLFFCTLAIVVTLFVQCSQSGERKDSHIDSKNQGTSCTSSKPLNPNGDSELALLMRNMTTSTSCLKELIKQGKLPDKFPEEFLKIHKAIPTDSAVKGAVFDALASSYLNGLNELYKSPKEELTIHYNAVVQRCVDCHREFCPGPIKAINKLLLPQ